MSDELLCLDTNVLVKFLTDEHLPEQSRAAEELVWRAIGAEHFVAPAFAWVEVGSVLCKKVRQGLLKAEHATELWASFNRLSIKYVDNPSVRTRAWQLGAEFGLPTLYDAAFLACTELAETTRPVRREFWTADQALLRQLGAGRPAYVRELGEL